MEVLLKLGLSVFELLLTFRFCNCFLEYKEKMNVRMISCEIILLAVLGTLVNSIFINSTLNLFVSISVITIALQCFEGKATHKVLIGTLYIVFSVLLESIVAITLEIIYHNRRIVIETESVVLFFGLIVTYMLKYVVIYYLKNTRKKVFRVNGVGIYLKQAISPTLSMLFLFYFMYLQLQKEAIDYTACYILIIVFAVINITIYVIYENTEKLYLNNYNTMKLNEVLRYRDNYYQDVEKHQTEIRKIRHNLKNQLIAIAGELENNHVEEVRQEIKGIIQDITQTEAKSFTRNIPVNAVLSAKYKEAAEKGIDCKFMITIPERLNLSGGDVGVLLGNTLDNAIEANQKCEEQHRFVSLDMNYFGNCLTFTMKNAVIEEMENKELKTNKKNQKEHGWGLVSVNEVVKKYHGDMVTSFDKGIFTISISLWNI